MARALMSKAASWLSIVCLAAAIEVGCITRVVVGSENSLTISSSSSSGATSGAGGTASGTSGNGTGASGGSSTGGSGTNGDTTGTPDSGCLPLAATCSASAPSDCCSGTCGDGEAPGVPGASQCRQPLDAGCFLPSDCSSDTCTDDTCACSELRCASAADCCAGICVKWYADVTACCIPTGSGPCPSTEHCCGGDLNYCIDGLCACAQPGEACHSDGDCCAGHCLPYFGVYPHSAGTLYSTCQLGPDEACDAGFDCHSNVCIDGVCASCGGLLGSCARASDCCDGMACAATLFALPVPVSGPLILYDAGAYCCSPAGGSCADAGDCCSLECTGGQCDCLEPGESCTNEQACCSGSCLAAFDHEDSTTACCQLNGERCGMQTDCCSGQCGADQKCACVPAGGQCGPIGTTSALGPAACCSGSCGDGGICQ